MSKKTALITGITGQDGSYLAEFLLEKGYRVVGMVRRTSTINFDRIAHIQDALEIVQGDLLDQSSLTDTIRDHRPDEVYNLAAQSFVPTLIQPTRAYGRIHCTGCHAHAGSRSAGKARYALLPGQFQRNVWQSRRGSPTRDDPRFIHAALMGVAKVYGHWITINYRESYNLFACNGILFNHESPRRGLEFVTHKVNLRSCAYQAWSTA